MRAVKDGAEARTRLELALVEAASPQVDPSARALMARLERLEAALAGGPPAATPAGAAAPSAPSQAARPDAAGDGRVAAARTATAPEADAPVAVADPPVPAPAASPVATLDGLTSVWPAVLDAVCADNQLLGAALSEARPVELHDDELVVAFAEGDAFNRRIADTPEHRATVEQAVRGLCGRPLRLRFELRDLGPPADDAPEPPSEDEIVARFVTEFDAEEIVPGPDDDKEGEA